jgi:DNA-binding PadR family transcriptional regulator
MGLSAEDERVIAERLIQEERVKHMAVLIFMLHADYCLEADLREAMTGGRYLADARTARAVLSDLLEMKLIESSKIKRYKVYRLTELGRKVAEELARRLDVEELRRAAEFTGRRGRPISIDALNKAALLAQLIAMVEAEAIIQGVDAQPLVRRLLLAAADHLREAGFAEQAAKVEEQARMLRAPSASEAEAVERAALDLAAKIALGGPKPEELAETLRLLAARRS